MARSENNVGKLVGHESVIMSGDGKKGKNQLILIAVSHLACFLPGQAQIMPGETGNEEEGQAASVPVFSREESVGRP